MRKITFACLLLVLLFVVTSCNMDSIFLLFQKPGETPKREVTTETENKAVYTKITPQDAKAYMDEGDYIVLDVRTPNEYAMMHIPGARNHAVENIDTISETIPDKNAKILVYCRSGSRSRQAALAMIEQGYSNVMDFGGILDWPYETTR